MFYQSTVVPSKLRFIMSMSHVTGLFILQGKGPSLDFLVNNICFKGRKFDQEGLIIETENQIVVHSLDFGFCCHSWGRLWY